VPAAVSVAAMTTISEVARIAGVSISTVSHVLNKTRYVSPEKFQRVTQVIAEVGYIPNTIARSLKMASSGTVGLAISAISNPYFSDIICAVEAECSRRGLTVFLCDTQDDPERELAVIRQLHQRRVDGIILAPSPAPEKSLDYLMDKGVPCVLVDRLADSRFDQVGMDNEAAITALVNHVVNVGHTRVGFVMGQPGFKTTMERMHVFRAAMAAHGLDVPDGYVSCSNRNTADAAVSTHKLLSLPLPPTAIIANNNLTMIGIMRATRERNLQVPRDLSILGIDDFEWADYFEPRLTLIAQPCNDIGQQAANLLIERIADPKGARRTLRLDPALKVRGSCGVPA
jgi:LacI family transcriptional regulator